MAEALPLFELELRIALLPPISRGAHLHGPILHARQLVELWKIDDSDSIPLAQAFRLLDAEAVAGAIFRTLAAGEYPSDSHRWIFPGLEDLLPELHALAWQDMRAGKLLVRAIKGVRGKRHREVLPAELPRLKPDWELSRLCSGDRDEFISTRVRRPPAEPIKKAWREKPSEADVEAAMKDVARQYPPGARPRFVDIWTALRARLGPELARDVARTALKDYAPHLGGRRGHRSIKPQS